MRVVFAAAGWKGGREVGRALRGRARGAPLGVAAFFSGRGRGRRNEEWIAGERERQSVGHGAAGRASESQRPPK